MMFSITPYATFSPSFISYIDSTVLNTSNITIQYNNTIKQNHIKSFGT